MRVPLTLAALVLTAGAAGAQSYQTSLPVSPAERRAIEARISTILDYARANEISRFSLPSGRTVAVRPYEMVRRQGGTPCRGYRVDLSGTNGSTAVDGFRCKRGAGQAWEITEPELVLERTGPASAQVVIEGRQPDEPIYPSDDRYFIEEPFAPEAPADSGGPIIASGPAPVPRPAPRNDVADADTADAEAPTEVAALEPSGPAPAAPEPLPPEPAEPAPAEVSAEPDPVTAPEPLPSTTPAQPPQVASVEAPAARIVGEEEVRTDTQRWSDNDNIVGALRDLEYIASDEDDDEETVSAAIDEFATDERFALPISPDALQERLDAAIDRSEMLPVCGSGEPDTFCLENE
ncbi:hypothetical protein RDV64_14260 [Acuticoccus sp. MNP-M23]|uniref:hypothetical protein n=1 Tax=Acuticoccus sp. MNP-M23 TaxID=3072793 RepID=UPI0028159E10|nr:hypothetical protein [Acuticoccus sp. MNP-M23]WMS41242.1 hypothetical protein RDV64_14260 [Acuticoccus sp. MNP-M23]